jgi:hypothetical protein
MFAGSRRAATARRQRGAARLKSAPKSENKNYNHFTPISGQASALAKQHLEVTGEGIMKTIYSNFAHTLEGD